MKKNILVLWLLIFCSYNGVSTDQVSCESIGNSSWGWGDWKTCYMYRKTEINSADTTIASRDGSIQGLWFNSNKKIKFLPIALSEKFPNLEGLDAQKCSLSTISKVNFKGLSKLQILYLSRNLIEKISNNVFDDLASLEYLFLDTNKLKFINGKAFARLTKLTHVDLSSNQCINENFSGASSIIKYFGSSRIAVLQQTVNAKCSFEELADKKCENSQDLTNLTTTIERMKTETSEIIRKLNEQKEKYESTAKAFEAQNKNLKDQQTHFNEALASKTAEIIEANKKLAESESQVMMKMTENGKLTEDLQRKDAEINEFRQKIKTLEAKVDILVNSGNCR